MPVQSCGTPSGWAPPELLTRPACREKGLWWAATSLWSNCRLDSVGVLGTLAAQWLLSSGERCANTPKSLQRQPAPLGWGYLAES